MKELEKKDDENCKCEDEKIVCTPKVTEPPVTIPITTTTEPVTRAPIQPPIELPTQPPTKPIKIEPTKEQKELFNVFNDVKTTLKHIKESPLYDSLPPKEKELNEMFAGHVVEFEDEINCQHKIADVQKCRCINNEEVCNHNIKNQQENQHEISNNLDLILFMKQHLKCVEDEFNNPENCTCINGQRICPEKEVLVSTTSRPKPKLYYYITKCERRIAVSLYNVQFAKKGQNCYKQLKENPSNCFCVDEQMVCYPNTPNPEENIRITKDTPPEVYNEYLNDAKIQLQCQARIANRQETCWCEKGKEVCEKRPQPIPERDNYEIINEYKESTINRNEIYDQFHKGLECTEDLGEDSQVCTCINGEKECFDMDFETPTEVEPSDDGDTDNINPSQKIITLITETEPKIVCLRKKNLGPNCRTYKMSHVKPTQEDVTQLNVYHQYIRHINEQLNCLTNKPSYCLCVNGKQECSFKEFNIRDIKEKERNQIIIYTTFLEHINAQMECLSRLNRESSGCFCDNGQQKCEKDKNYVIYPLFDNHVLEEYDVDKKFTEIENQLECFNALKSISMKCSCRNGAMECEPDEDLRKPEPNDELAKVKRNIPEQLKTIKTIERKMYCIINNGAPRPCGRVFSPQKVVPVISQDDKQLLKVYGNYFDHIELQLSCFANITSPNCMCSNGKLVCGIEIENMNERRTKVANTLQIYALFINYVESQLNCVESLGDNQFACNCGIEKMCGENPRRNKLVSLVDATIYNNRNINSQLKCLSELNNRNDRQCYCSNGLMICDEQFERRCPEIKCPKNSKLVKKCAECCPECETEHCLVPTTLRNGTIKLIPKQLDESWMENICKECYCKKDDIGTYTQCIQYICPVLNSQDILYKYVKEEGKCCPQPVQIGCKHNERSYPLGSIISKTLCETLSCVKNRHGDIVKQIHKTICSPCPKGFNYTPSTTHCCGECTAMGCMYNNEIKQLGDVWYTEDKCYKVICTQVNGRWILSRQRKICRPIRNCNGIIEKRECCNYCNTSVL
nr:uncharacterized protein LOC111415360 isoform X2 [Onthophagus taurus]